MEIERKYLVAKLPDQLETYPCRLLEQGYLNTNPVVRIRRDNEKYELTYKSAGLMSRQEYNLPLDRESYHHLLGKIDGRLIKKKRYVIPLSSGLTAELDIFEGLFDGLVMGEVEFPDEETAKRYTLPDSFAVKKEVTYDTHFHNSTMSAMRKEEIAQFIASLSA